MAKIVHSERRGRKAADGSSIIYEGAPGGTRKIRCPGSHQLATPARAKDGSSVLRTPGGTTYVSKPLK